MKKTNAKLKKYKVEFVQTETFIVDVLAKTEQEAKNKSLSEFNGDNYQEVGDCEIHISNVYDVSETDDPFNP